MPLGLLMPEPLSLRSPSSRQYQSTVYAPSRSRPTLSANCMMGTFSMEVPFALSYTQSMS
jgi:hypothetical protein